MPAFIAYKDVQVETPTPSGAAGVVLNSNFTALADRNQ
jgi:hypothetical protein